MLIAGIIELCPVNSSISLVSHTLIVEFLFVSKLLFYLCFYLSINAMLTVVHLHVSATEAEELTSRVEFIAGVDEHVSLNEAEVSKLD